MADIKWIKITTDIFDDEKILMIESLPDADAIIVIWFKLLCLAGKQNNSGVFMLNDRIPYTDKMLATIFRRKESTVQLALQTFEQFGMIEVIDGVITIPNWGKHQNFDAIEKKNAYMKEYMREYRKKQRLLAEHHEGEANVSDKRKANVSRAEEDIEEEIDIDRDIPPYSPPTGGDEALNKQTTVETAEKKTTGTSRGKTVDTQFERFWKAYPKKKGKDAARKAFKRVTVPVETLLDAIEKQKTWSEWQRDNGQYIPNPSTWLNQGRWEDEEYHSAGKNLERDYEWGSDFFESD